MRESIRREPIPVSPDRFWEDLFFDESFTRASFLEGYRCTHVDIVHTTRHPDGKISRRIEATVPISAPRPLRKIIGETVPYAEEGTYDPATGKWLFDVEPMMLKDRVKITGEMYLEPPSPGASAKELAVEVSILRCEVRIPGLSGMAEKLILKEHPQTLGNYITFLNDWVARHPS